MQKLIVDTIGTKEYTSKNLKSLVLIIFYPKLLFKIINIISKDFIGISIFVTRKWEIFKKKSVISYDNDNI